MHTTTWRKALRTGERPVACESKTPITTEHRATAHTELATAGRPLRKNHGTRGTAAPTEKLIREDPAAGYGDGREEGSIPISSRAWVWSAISGVLIIISASEDASSGDNPRCSYSSASSWRSASGSRRRALRSTSSS